MLNEMGQRKVMPDVQTSNILVDTLCKEGMLTEGKKVFDVMIQRGIDPNIVTYNSLIDVIVCKTDWMRQLRHLI